MESDGLRPTNMKIMTPSLFGLFKKTITFSKSGPIKESLPNRKHFEFVFQNLRWNHCFVFDDDFSGIEISKVVVLDFPSCKWILFFEVLFVNKFSIRKTSKRYWMLQQSISHTYPNSCFSTSEGLYSAQLKQLKAL